MKKDRNCMGGNMPVYPIMYNGAIPINNMQPGFQMPTMGMNFPMTNPYMNTSMNNYATSDINSLIDRLSSLENRISALENIINQSYSNNYNTSNYQMV